MGKGTLLLIYPRDGEAHAILLHGLLLRRWMRIASS
jgi:hypothetical protein